MTRRDAAKITGAAALATAAVPFIHRARAADNPVAVGVIGTGERGRYHLKHLAGVQSGRCLAVCDSYEANLRAGIKSASTKPQGYSDYRALLDRKDIEAVIVATSRFVAMSFCEPRS